MKRFLVAVAALLTSWRLTVWLKRPLQPDPRYSEDRLDSVSG